ncbi:MAG: UDP-3-O-(3-hydroxymyristoyl)glucosamine N-acyltransferase [Candidatus Cloacimonadota bacterium]|nr:MAG: UDP-3-O-(3-hydroxymyristoyl)glucosamine N-acyltransferase [Candidatus Cloacimonadota bacterium]
MKIFAKHFRISQISELITEKKIIRKDILLTNVSELKEANENSVCFFENEKFLDALKSSKAGLIFVPTDFNENIKPNSNLIFCNHPYYSFMKFVKIWLESEATPAKSVISEKAVISETAIIGKNVIIGHNTVIKENVEIGDNSVIEDNCVIGKKVRIGNNCHIYPNTTIYEECIIKNNVIIHAGCVIGADGFGYLPLEGKQQKIPQIGNVIIENDVEIGANSTIDRATLGSTIIGRGTKIDNLVQIGHNCKIGEDSVICAQVGLAGSTEVGNRVYLAGQVGAAGHLKIDDDAMIGAQSGIYNNIPKNARYLGYPAIDASLQKRIFAVQRKLPEIVKFINKEMKKAKKED